MPAGDRYVILAEFTPYDPVGGAPVTVRACSVDDARVTTLNSVAWWPTIATAPRRTLDLFDGDFGGRIAAGIGDIELAYAAAFPLAPRYSWGEQPVKLWRGKLGDAWGSYTQIFQGLTRPARASNGRMRIGLRVDDRWLDKPLLSTYLGTGSAEGPADLKGVPKPLALGAPQFIEGVIVNRTLNIVQLHGYGAMNAVNTALDRLNRYGAAAGNDANYAALAGATIAAGAWRTCVAEGLVRFGAPPGGVASFLAQGDSGSGLGWVRTPGQVIRRIALIAGASAGQIDTTSLAALDTAVPYNISLHLRDQTTAREVIQSIAASCNAAAGISHLGKLFVTRAGIGSPVITLSANGSSLPPVASVELLEQSAPFWRIALDSVRTERVHAASEYGAIGAGDLAFADGTTVEALKPAQAGADVTGANTAAGAAWSGVAGVGRPSDYADVTAQVAPDVQGNLLWELNADFAGTITTALPSTRRFQAFQGNTDVSATSTWVLSSVPSTVLLTVNNTGDRGLLTLAAGTTTGGTCKLTVTFPTGTIIERIITLTKTNAAAPITGGAGATTASDTSLTTVSSGTHATISDELTVRSDGASKVRISVGSGYRGAGADVQVAFKASYATTSGGSLTDIFSEVNGTTSVWDTIDNFQYAGNITLAETQYTLPAANTDYFFKLQARRVSGSGNAVFESSQFLVRQ